MEIKINLNNRIDAMHIIASLDPTYDMTQMFGDKKKGAVLMDVISQINHQLPPVTDDEKEQYRERRLKHDPGFAHDVSIGKIP